jgi:hypothetical protein
MQQRILLLLVGVISVLAAGCANAGDADVVEARVLGMPIAQAKPAHGGEGGFEACPVTLPGEAPFSPPAPYSALYPYEGRSWYGSASLWTALPDDGRWAQLLHGDKVFWWREGYSGREEPQPSLFMTAKRLDGEGSVQQEPPATNAYHRDFRWAMLSGFEVPASGCWEITGHYEMETLRFVVWVGA